MHFSFLYDLDIQAYASIQNLQLNYYLNSGIIFTKLATYCSKNYASIIGASLAMQHTLLLILYSTATRPHATLPTKLVIIIVIKI